MHDKKYLFNRLLRITPSQRLITTSKSNGGKETKMDRAEKFWDRMSKKFDKRVKRYEQIYNKTIEKTKKYLDADDIVLDYACGTGIITNEIAGNVKMIHAIDLSTKMIDAAKRKAGERKIKNIDYAPATIFNKKYKRGSFDAILVFNVLHLLQDTPQVLQRINELLKPGGVVVSATACLGEKKTFLSILIFIISKIGIVPYIRFFKFSELEDLIAKGNFQIVETEGLSDSYFIAAKKI